MGIIEKENLGGVCLNVGCVPSKALLRNAELAYLMRTSAKEFGISFENLQLDYSAAYKRSRQVSQRLTNGISCLMKKNNIEVINGEGKLTVPGQPRGAGGRRSGRGSRAGYHPGDWRPCHGHPGHGT